MAATIRRYLLALSREDTTYAGIHACIQCLSRHIVGILFITTSFSLIQSFIQRVLCIPKYKIIAVLQTLQCRKLLQIQANLFKIQIIKSTMSFKQW